MLNYKFKKSIAEVKEVKAIQFSIIPPEYIKNISVTQTLEINGQEISRGINYENNDKNIVTLGAINDERMGNTNDLEHPGYFGHIELAQPMYHVGFIKHVIDVLKCVSFYTSKILVNTSTLKRGKKNIKEIIENSKSIKECPVTKKKLPNYYRNGIDILIEFDKTKEILSSNEVYKILEKISDADAQLLGFNTEYNRPEHLLITVLPVPPPHVRPSVFMSSSQKCDDDLTTKLNEIVKANIDLKNKMNEDKNGSSKSSIQIVKDLLQYHISTYIDNQHPGDPPCLQRSGKLLKTLRERLSGKDGRIRGNLMGKRVDYSARAVITADPNLSIDQVGVPLEIALNITVPEVVNEYNHEKLLLMVKNGPNIYPGAKFIIKTIIRNGQEQNVKLDLNYATINDLKNGWIVERHLCDNDPVLFNRQPSLHKMSIMTHRVKVLPGLTFRLNLSCTSPYNADFDGDEMNMYVLQNLNAIKEAEDLMIVNKMIVSPQSNKPVIGIIQDSLLSSFKLTHKGIFLNKIITMNMLACVNIYELPPPTIIKNGIEYWTGKQIFSLIIPKKLNIESRKDDLIIRNGKLLSGIIDKNMIGKSNGGIIHILFSDFGSEIAKVFLNQVQKLSNYWIKNYGFTIGVGDCLISEDIRNSVEKIITDTKEKIKDIIKNDEGKSSSELEHLINTELNTIISEAGKVAENSISISNGIKSTVKSGSKGSSLNISQIMALVGQQNVEGNRIFQGFSNRTLPHFQKYEISPESRGFVENSYIKGLNPSEFWFHSMAGREGLVDTACKTSETGYTQRRLVKALEDVGIKYDYTVRNSKGSIIQFLYGGDGLDATYLENIHLKYMKYSYSEMENQYKHKNMEEFDEIISYWRDMINIAKLRHYNNIKLDDDYFPMPVNIERLLIYCREINFSNIQWLKFYGNNIKQNQMEDVIYKEVKKLEDRILGYFSPNSSKIFRIYLRIELCTKKILNAGLNYYQFMYLLEEIEQKYKKSIAHPGEMCGVLAAQSIGEPATQMCVSHDSTVCILEKNEISKMKICDFINRFFNSEKFHLDDGKSFNNIGVLNIQRENIKILSVNQKSGKVEWSRINLISKILPEGDLIKVTTKLGKTVTATLSHAFLIKNPEKETGINNKDGKKMTKLELMHSDLILNVLGSKLQLGDKIPICTSIKEEYDYESEFKYYDEYCGMKINMELCSNISLYISGRSSEILDSSVLDFLSENFLNSEYGDFKLPSFVYNIEKKYIMKICEKFRSGCNVEMYSLQFTDDLSILLSLCNIFSYRKDNIFFLTKQDDDVIFDEIVSIERILEKDYANFVYDFTINSRHTFMVNSCVFVHNTLNTFHSAGVSAKNVTLGVPRLKELINITKKLKTPSLTLYAKSFDPNISYKTQTQLIKCIKSNLEYKILQDLIVSSDILDPNNQSPNSKHLNELDDYVVDFYSNLYNINFSKFMCLRFDFSPNLLETSDTSIYQIAGLINKKIGNKFIVICSDDNNDEIFIRIYEKNYQSLKSLKDVELNLMPLKIKGVENLDKVYIRKGWYNNFSEEKGHYKSEQWILETDGTNLINSFQIDGIDHKKTMSNDIIEIYETLGIEAARQALLNELESVLSFDGSYVNHRHLSLLVDTMTHKGTLTAMTRHGINRASDIGPLTKASFEETVEVLNDAAVFGEIDNLKGISDNIILGKLIPAGTGTFDVLYDDKPNISQEYENYISEEFIFSDPMNIY